MSGWEGDVYQNGKSVLINVTRLDAERAQSGRGLEKQVQNGSIFIWKCITRMNQGWMWDFRTSVINKLAWSPFSAVATNCAPFTDKTCSEFPKINACKIFDTFQNRPKSTQKDSNTRVKTAFKKPRNTRVNTGVV